MAVKRTDATAAPDPGARLWAAARAGASGSGKSTLLTILSGLDVPTAGTPTALPEIAPVPGTLDDHRRPHAEVWTSQQVAAWRENGQRPTVAAWTPQQLAAFLAAVADDRHYPRVWVLSDARSRFGGLVPGITS